MSVDFTKAAHVLSNATEVALACHVNPDADALGSMLGLAAHLRERGVSTTCSYPNDPLEPPRWASMLPGSERRDGAAVMNGVLDVNFDGAVSPGRGRSRGRRERTWTYRTRGDRRQPTWITPTCER